MLSATYRRFNSYITARNYTTYVIIWSIFEPDSRRYYPVDEDKMHDVIYMRFNCCGNFIKVSAKLSVNVVQR